MRKAGTLCILCNIYVVLLSTGGLFHVHFFDFLFQLTGFVCLFGHDGKHNNLIIAGDAHKKYQKSFTWNELLCSIDEKIW